MKVQKGQFLRSDEMDKEREKNYKYIKNFSKIKVTRICKKLKISRQNVLNNKTTTENIIKVKEEIENELARLYLRNDDNE